MKTCNSCKTDRPAEDFPKDRSKRDGRNSKCKACNRADCSRRYLLNKESRSQTAKKWAKENKEKMRLSSKAWRDKNIEKARASERAYYCRNAKARLANTRKWNELNRERIAAATREWAKNNPHRKRRDSANRKAAKLQRTPAWLTAGDLQTISELYKKARILEEETGIPHEVDHVLPLQGKKVSGLHVPLNLRVIPKRENRQKHNKYEVL